MQAYNVNSQLLRADTAIGATVATTVASLGTATDGKIGLIRAGGTGGIADSWKMVVYDATYAKWITPEESRELLIREANGQSTNNATYVDVGGGWTAAIQSAKAFSDAGLSLQTAVAWVVQSEASSTARGAILAFRDLADDGNMAGGANLATANEVTGWTANSTNRAKFSGWEQPALTITAAHLQLIPQIKNDGTRTTYLQRATARLRWVG